MARCFERPWITGGVLVAAIGVGVACGEDLSDDSPDPIPPLRDSGSNDLDGAIDADAGIDGAPTTACVDIKTQPEHCGACNRHCRGGQCVNGVCTPALLAEGQVTPLGIAVDGTHVYWTSSTDSGSIQRIPKATFGSGKSEVFDSTAGIQPKGIAVNSTTVYWTTYEELHRRAKDGSSKFDLGPPLPTQGIWWISATDDAVYFSSELGAAVGVFKTSTVLVGATHIAKLVTIPFAVENDVVWGAGKGSSKIFVTDGGASGETTTSFDNVNWVALGPNDVWWTHAQGLGHVTRAALPGSSPANIEPGTPKPGGLVFDAARGEPYYVTSTHVMKLTNGVLPEPLIAAPCSDTPGQLAQDADTLYWTCPPDGKVWRWTKPPN